MFRWIFPLAACLSAFFFHLHFTEKELALYRKAIVDSDSLHAKKGIDGKPLKQYRLGVCKDFWTMREGKRVHSRVVSNSSDLTLMQNKEKFHGEEMLKEVVGQMDTLHFQSETAHCHFPENTAQFTQFHSDEVHATKINIDQDLAILFEVNGFLEKQNTRYQADSGAVYFHELKPKRAHLDGGVQMAFSFKGKPSFSLADSFSYYSREKRMVFDCIPSKKVLFWQEGYQIAAPSVLINDTIQAIGDVRFDLTSEENTALNNFFSKYL